MSVKLPKRLSSKKKQPPKDNVHAEILHKLGLEANSTTPLDPASVLDISTWALEKQAPQELKDLPNAFLQRLWLLSQDARSSCIQPQHNGLNKDNASPTEELNGFESESQNPINPLDLVASVFMSANTFLQQEMTVRMMQCQFAVPLVLPNVDPEEPSNFLLWPLRAVVSRWCSHVPDMNQRLQEGDLASTDMPIVSCVKLGSCSVSKSQVLNHVLKGLKSDNETFVHRGMHGGELPRKLSNGLVEIGWYLPTGDISRDIFPVPVVISNLRGNASIHEKCLDLLCQASSALVVFCGELREKEKQLLISCNNVASKIILIDVSDTDKRENRVVEFVGQSLEEQLGLPKGSVLQGSALNEEDTANKLCDILRDLLPDTRLKLVSLEAVAKLALEIGLNVDEGPACKKAMATVEEVLKGLDGGSAEYRMKQFPLQGPLWSKLGELDKMENKQRKKGEIDPQLQKQKKDILAELSSYRMTPAMKLFTDALFTPDKMERTYFLTWLKLRLGMTKTKKQNSSQELLTVLQTENKNSMPEHLEDLEHRASNSVEDSDSFCSSSLSNDVTDEQPENTELQVSEQTCEIVKELQAVMQSTEKTTESPSQETEHLTSIPSFASPTKNDSQGAEIAEETVCIEDQTSHQVSEDQICTFNSESLSCKGGQPDIPEITPETSDLPESTSPASQQMCQKEVASSSQPPELDPHSIGLEHFLREMGLIFELTHVSPSSGSHNVLRLPSLATELLLYGVPLEIMDGDASNIPMCWLGCVFAELKRRLSQEQLRTRVLTSLGTYNARNDEVLSALFGIKFPEGGRTTNRGVYMAALCLPCCLRKDIECDLLLLIDVEGLCSFPTKDNKNNMLIHDNEMATIAIGLSDVLMQNVSQNADDEFETGFSVMVNALLRIKELGSLPICQILAQDEGINSILQASQIKHVYKMLLTETESRGSAENPYAKTMSSASFVKGPWSKMCLSEPIDKEYSKAVLKLRKNLFEMLKRCAAKSETLGLPEFMGRLCAVWDSVKSESFSTGLQNTDVALAFSLLCTEFSQWEQSLQENMESWLMDAATKIFATKVKALNTSVQNDLLNELKTGGQEEVKSEVNKVKSKAEAYLMKDDLKIHAETFRPILMSNVGNLQDRVIEEITQKLETVNEIHCSSTQLKKFESMLEEKQEFKLLALVETSKSTKLLLQDSELEEEFEDVWSKTLADFDFRPSESDDIMSRVRDVLRQNVVSRGLQKHMKKLDTLGQNQTSDFQVYDEHFGYRSRLKHMFEDNNRQQRIEAQQLSQKIIEEYKQFAAHKCSLPSDFSDSYIVEMLENVEKTLMEKSMEIRSAFEVDLKLHLCNAACQDFQKLHDRYAKDRELLTCISAAKTKYLAEFIYSFRKRDECQRMAQAFSNMVLKPTALDYINRPLGMQIVEEITDKVKQYQSPQAFQQSLLEELIKEDNFESFKEYLLSYDNFRLQKIQDTVEAHLSESTSLSQWRQQRLGEIIGKIAAAVNQTPEGTNGVLSDTKPLLERVCLTLEEDADIDVTRASLNGPLFSITTKWDHFVKCLMELLATMRLDLGQEFSQNVDIAQLLNSFSVHPKDYLFKIVKGCDKQCPLCGAPCEEEELGHEVHKALLHRPKGMMPYDSSSLSCISCPESKNPDHNTDVMDVSMTCKDLHSLYPNWTNLSDDPDRQRASDYWRYVLTRFSERFAKEFQQEPAKIPEEWKKITQEEALDSLKEVFPTREK